MARWVFTLTLLLSLLGSNVFAEADDPSWRTVLTARVRAGEPIVVHVTVALCDNAQIACGSGGLGSPGNLRSNLYWGALFGAKRFFDRPEQGWEAIEQRREIGGVLERAVYRRWVDGSRWGRRRRVEQLVNPDISGLPPFLAKDPGLESGFMIPQVVAASLASENKTLAHPASVDTVPSSIAV